MLSQSGWRFSNLLATFGREIALLLLLLLLLLFLLLFLQKICPDWRKVFIDFLTGLLYTVVRRVCAPQIGPAGRLACLLVGGTFI